MITSQNIIQIRRRSVWVHLSSYTFYRNRPLYNRLDFDIHRWIGFHDKVLCQVHTQYQSIVKKFHIFHQSMTDPKSCNNLASSLCDIDTRHQRNNSVKFITDYRGNSVFRMIWWSFDTYIIRICYFHFITFFFLNTGIHSSTMFTPESSSFGVTWAKAHFSSSPW